MAQKLSSSGRKKGKRRRSPRCGGRIQAEILTMRLKVKRLARLFRGYKMQPPKALNGLRYQIRQLVENEMAKAGRNLA